MLLFTRKKAPDFSKSLKTVLSNTPPPSEEQKEKVMKSDLVRALIKRKEESGDTTSRYFASEHTGRPFNEIDAGTARLDWLFHTPRRMHPLRVAA